MRIEGEPTKMGSCPIAVRGRASNPCILRSVPEAHAVRRARVLSEVTPHSKLVSVGGPGYAEYRRRGLNHRSCVVTFSSARIPENDSTVGVGEGSEEVSSRRQ